MTIRRTIERLLGGGDVGDVVDESDGSGQLVEIAVVPLGSGPMTVASLCDEGFAATGAPTFNIVTDVASDYRILVPRHQAAAATARLDHLL